MKDFKKSKKIITVNSCAIGRVDLLNGHEKTMKTVKGKNHEKHENGMRKSRKHESILTIIDISVSLLCFLDPVFLLNVFSPCLNLLPILGC